MTHHFEYRAGSLYAEDLAVTDLATEFGTPLYIYSRATLTRHYRAWADPVGSQGMICYAVKANSNIGLLSVLAQLGSGFDIVSQGELERVLLAGGEPSKILFSGVGKTAREMRRALEVGIGCFNVESEPELERLNQVAADMGVMAPISLRVNPDVDANTHPYISTGLKENKFGIDILRAPEVYAQAAALSNLHVVGVDCHIGSQLTQLAPYFDALDRVLALVDQLSEQGITLEHIDLGGGLGVNYNDEAPPLPAELYAGVRQRMADRPQKIYFEPGRSIAANAGMLISRVEYLKTTDSRNFAIVDAAMNDLIRPSLYQAWMRISEVEQRSQPQQTWDIVGPICESGDFLGKQRQLAIKQGDLVCVHSAGAYAFTMSSNYNSRPRAAEVLVDGSSSTLIRARESFEDLVRGEATP